MLAALAVPFVVMRAAMMELDCFIARKKELELRGGGCGGGSGGGGGAGGGDYGHDEVDSLLVGKQLKKKKTLQFGLVRKNSIEI